MAMVRGESVALRPVVEADLDVLWEAHVDLADRGDHFPRNVVSQPEFRRAFHETGLWQPDDGTLLITVEDMIVGHIEFFRPVSYWDAYELSYRLYDRARDGKGLVTEAVQLLVDYLFDTKQRQRIQLVIAPENRASCRIADKCGFTLEGTCRGAFFNHGRSNDVLMYSLLRTDSRPWRPPAGVD